MVADEGEPDEGKPDEVLSMTTSKMAGEILFPRRTKFFLRLGPSSKRVGWEKFYSTIYVWQASGFFLPAALVETSSQKTKIVRGWRIQGIHLDLQELVCIVVHLKLAMGSPLPCSGDIQRLGEPSTCQDGTSGKVSPETWLDLPICGSLVDCSSR